MKSRGSAPVKSLNTRNKQKQILYTLVDMQYSEMFIVQFHTTINKHLADDGTKILRCENEIKVNQNVSL